MHSPLAVSAGDRQCHRESAIAPVHTLLMFPQYLGTRNTSQPFIKQKYDLCIWLPPSAIPKRCARSLAKGVPPEPNSVVRNYTMVSARGFIDGTDFITQVFQTCYHPVTKTPSNCSLSPAITSVIHCTTTRPVFKIRLHKCFSNIASNFLRYV
jgi:hypothetical protein